MTVPWKIVELPAHRTPGKPGLLAVAELAELAPGFFPADAAPRVYFIVNDSGGWSARGGHYHPDGGKRELLLALQGTVEFDLHSADDCMKIVSDTPTRGLLIPNGVWHGVRLSPGAVLLSIASTVYAPDEARAQKPCGCP